MDITRLKQKVAKEQGLKKLPKNIELALEGKEIKTKPMRTQSGVAPVAIMTEPRECEHGSCTFCPGGMGSYFGDIPKSYTGNEPASMRAMRNKFDAYLQVFNRLEHYVLLGQVPEKVELIVMGGTFLSYPKNYQEGFVKDALQAMNDFGELFFVDGELDKEKFKEFFDFGLDFKSEERTKKIHKKLSKLKKETTLEGEQERNEGAKIRCPTLTIETKPDWCFEEHINQALKLGATRIEVGIQTLSDDILKRVNRGHTLTDSVKATRLLKDSLLKITFHMMPGLPNSTPEEDINNFKELFDNEDYKPDGLKIYPCMVMPGTPLFRQYQRGEFRPLRTKEAAEIVAKGKGFIPRFCRVYRVNRDIPTKVTVDGVGLTNFRQVVHALMEKNGEKCKCIRCREIRNEEVNWGSVKLNRIDYDASGGKEVFLSFDDVEKDNILGFLRLRKPSKSFRPEITNKSAGIREVHVYGEATSLGEKGKIQHRGLGIKLVKEAERIAMEEWNCDKMVIISGIGVKSYFRNKFGYQKDGPYMSKKL
jgi:elongator complex protein 3